MLFIMTEETIKNTLTETRKQVLSAESHYEIAAKQILEQHEAEMVLFKEWCEEKETAIRIDHYLTKKTYLTTTDLLTLFKNRNK